MLPDRHAAADNKDLVLCPALDRFEQGLAFITTMLHEIYDCTAASHQCIEQHRIAVINLSLFNFLTLLHQLVTGRNDCRVHFAADSHIGETLGSQKGSRCGANPLALRQNHLTFG